MDVYVLLALLIIVNLINCYNCDGVTVNKDVDK